MVVEHKTAPAGERAAPGHPGTVGGGPFRRGSFAAVAVGLVLIVAAGLWALIAPGQLVKFDTSDQTVVADGQFTLSIDPTTAAPLSTPQVLPLHIERTIHVVRMQDNTAIVSETDKNVINQSPATFSHQYVVDRSTLLDVKSSDSWAYTSSNVVDRSAGYSVNLPFDTGSGPYSIWNNEAGRAYTFTQQGSSFSNDGITVLRFQGHLASSPAQPAYIAALKPAGIPESVTLTQLAPQLKAAGVDVAALTTALVPTLSASDLAALQAASAAPIKLNYTVTADSTILVEQRTGAIVSLDKTQTLSSTIDPAALTTFGGILAKHTDVPAVAQALPILTQLASAPPSTVFTASYKQTPASVQSLSDYVNGQGNRIDLVKTYVPIGLLIAGVAFAGMGAAFMVARAPRRRAMLR